MRRWWARFRCESLGWHRPDDSPSGFDGCSVTATCRRCHRPIMLDSQGNWF